ncbi:MAG: TRAP transporter small permease subunit [Oceanospirillaceae bacterium]
MSENSTQWLARIDSVNHHLGHSIRWFALIMVLLQFAIVMLRYLFGISFIFLSETVLYLHAALFMLGAGYTMLVDGHVRVDIFYATMSLQKKAVINLFGHVFFLLPMCVLIIYMSWRFVLNSWSILEGPLSVGGIPASFILKTIIPLFCILLIVQASAAIARDFIIAFSTGSEKKALDNEVNSGVDK